MISFVTLFKSILILNILSVYNMISFFFHILITFLPPGSLNFCDNWLEGKKKERGNREHTQGTNGLREIVV